MIGCLLTNLLHSRIPGNHKLLDCLPDRKGRSTDDSNLDSPAPEADALSIRPTSPMNAACITYILKRLTRTDPR